MPADRQNCSSGVLPEVRSPPLQNVMRWRRVQLPDLPRGWLRDRVPSLDRAPDRRQRPGRSAVITTAPLAPVHERLALLASEPLVRVDDDVHRSRTPRPPRSSQRARSAAGRSPRTRRRCGGRPAGPRSVPSLLHLLGEAVQPGPLGGVEPRQVDRPRGLHAVRARVLGPEVDAGYLGRRRGRPGTCRRSPPPWSSSRRPGPAPP
jgi:hypothetical protein